MSKLIRVASFPRGRTKSTSVIGDVEVRTIGPAVAALASQLGALQHKSDQFTGFSELQLRVMAPYFEVRQLTDGDAVFHEGDRGDFYGVVLDGQLGVVVRGELLAMLQPVKGGVIAFLWWFGIGSFVQERPDEDSDKP